MKIDWLGKLLHYVQTMAFCLTVSALQYAFRGERPYEVPLVYSLCVGTFTWALIDFGRHAFPSAAETGWPQGLAGWFLPLAGIAAGFLLGTLAGDWWFGWSTWEAAGRSELALSITISALAGLVITYYFYSRNKAQYYERKMTEARRLAAEARLKLLETQLEPHMLFNTLANLRVLIGSDPARAQGMLDRIIAYLRATLDASRHSAHPLQAEFDRLRDYLELMAVRMGPRLHYTLDLPDDLARQTVPTLLLQPLVENCIKHGLEPKIQGGSITVRARREGTLLLLDVSDTGVGFDMTAGADGGFGIAQVRERLAAAYGDLARVAQRSERGAGSVTALQLPLKPAPA